MRFIKDYWLTILSLLIAIVIIGFMPYLFTERASSDRFDFTNTGNIGDTISRITAPFIGLLSIVLLFITLQEQIKINKKTISHNDFNLLLSLQSQIQDRNSNLIFKYDINNTRVEGRGIFDFDNLYMHNDYDISISTGNYNSVIS